MVPDLKGRGLFIFSDPGGAKPVLALITLLKSLTAYKIISDREYPFISDFGLHVEQYKNGEEIELFENYKPDFLFTGTSYTSGIELRFINEAKENKIISYAFIDHYTRFEDRFLLNNTMVFPDHICLVDEKAKEIGSKTILPNDRFLITGNFYHTWLRMWAPSISKEDLFNTLNIPIDNKLLVYAPDPLSNAGGIGKYGLDEASILENIMQVLDEKKFASCALLIKMHPNQNKDILLDIIPKNKPGYIVADDRIDTNSLLYYSDAVIGIFSSILIESAIMNKNVIRCLIDFKEKDPLETNNIGVVVRDSNELKREMLSILA